MIALSPLIGLLMLLVPHAGRALPRVDPGADEACFVQQTNATRAAKGLSVLPVLGSLAGQARTHTQAMASSNSLYHSTADHYPGDWTGLGENVGVGPTCDDIQQAFLASPHHYENIVDPKWTSMGVGVVASSDGTQIWVTVGFEQWQTAAPAPAPAPTPARTTPAPAPARTTAPAPAPAPARSTVAPAPTRTAPRPSPAPSRTTAPTPPPATQPAPPSASPSPPPPPSAAPLVEQASTPTESATPTPVTAPATSVPQVLAAAKASRGVLGLGVAVVLCLAVGGVWGIRDRRRR